MGGWAECRCTDLLNITVLSDNISGQFPTAEINLFYDSTIQEPTTSLWTIYTTDKMALHIEDDEFGLSPSDEEDIIALTDDPYQGVKRKASFIEDSTRTKKAAIESTGTFPSAVRL